MGDLPYNKTESGQPPSDNTGINYFEPNFLKQSRRTTTTGKTKKWRTLFTQLNTQAMHLEIV